jgi:hypothetical protein
MIPLSFSWTEYLQSTIFGVKITFNNPVRFYEKYIYDP